MQTETDRIQIVFPPAMKQFITEIMEACGLDFEDYVRDTTECIEREVMETFDGQPFVVGILDHVEARYGIDDDERPDVLKVIEKHRGRFRLAVA
jgi:hypothetical protein